MRKLISLTYTASFIVIVALATSWMANLLIDSKQRQDQADYVLRQVAAHEQARSDEIRKIRGEVVRLLERLDGLDQSSASEARATAVTAGLEYR